MLMAFQIILRCVGHKKKLIRNVFAHHIIRTILRLIIFMCSLHRLIFIWKFEQWVHTVRDLVGKKVIRSFYGFSSFPEIEILTLIFFIMVRVIKRYYESWPYNFAFFLFLCWFNPKKTLNWANEYFYKCWQYVKLVLLIQSDMIIYFIFIQTELCNI